jgi:uncharacterized protein YegL
MQFSQFKKDTLIEIGIFLSRRWSGKNDIIIGFSDKGEIRSTIRDRKIILPSIEKLSGKDFQKYRQFRTMLWYESMRLAICKKILSVDHAYGFILNALETRRIELVGREIWKGMDSELIFNYSFQWNYRPLLTSIYGKARTVEAFYQYLLFDDIKGELSSGQFEKIKKAAKFAKEILAEAVSKKYDTLWLEKKVPEIIKILGIDSLLTIPAILPWVKPGMVLSEKELLKTLIKISKNRDSDFKKIDPKSILEGKDILDEYKVLTNEDKKNQNNEGIDTGTIGIQIPPSTNVNEMSIYDLDLINRLKTKFKDWKTGWKEQHLRTGDEFDEESYIEGHEPFFTDFKKNIKTEIMIMLDHSSSISSEEKEYKKATLALCQVLSELKVEFSVYAFSTVDKAIVCWMIKSNNQKWNNICAKRLAQIVANGSTPLAEVYNKMFTTIQTKRPKIFLTLTDGEPADPAAAYNIIKSIKVLGIKMVAIGLGSNIVRSTTIANNLKQLGYERTVAVSRLSDMPNKVIGLLGEET